MFEIQISWACTDTLKSTFSTQTLRFNVFRIFVEENWWRLLCMIEVFAKVKFLNLSQLSLNLKCNFTVILDDIIHKVFELLNLLVCQLNLNASYANFNVVVFTVLLGLCFHSRALFSVLPLNFLLRYRPKMVLQYNIHFLENGVALLTITLKCIVVHVVFQLINSRNV